MDLLVWQLFAGAECALVMWLVARLLRVQDRTRKAFYHLEAVRFTRRIRRYEARAFRKALQAIANLDTPKAAHGVKKAVAIARGALS